MHAGFNFHAGPGPPITGDGDDPVTQDGSQSCAGTSLRCLNFGTASPQWKIASWLTKRFLSGH